MSTAYVGIGANLGDPRAQVRLAFDELDGIPGTIKDNLMARGWPTRRGSLTCGSEPAADDAPQPGFGRGALRGGRHRR